MHSSCPPSQHPEPLHIHLPSPLPHIKGHQSSTVQGKGKYLEKARTPINLRRRTRYPPYSSNPTPSIQVPRQSWVLTARGSPRRPQEPEEERRRSVATPVMKTMDIKKRKRETEDALPHSVETWTLKSVKQKHTRTKRVHAHTHACTDMVPFDLVQLSVPLEWDSRILLSIYVLIHLKTIWLSVIKKGTLHWQVRVGRSLGE